MILEDAHDFFFGGDVQERILVKNSYAAMSLILFYILLVEWIGPALMKSSKPFEMKKVIIVYNFSQVAVNMYIAYGLVAFGIKIWDDRCVIYKSPNYMLHIKATSKLIWLLYLVKISDLLDTVFFVLRKKNSQITFLHVFHHAAMCIFFHFGIKNLKLGYFLLIGISINNIIHVIMYFYYALAAFGPWMQRYLWWKKYLTMMQMIQFITILVYMTHAFITGCEELGALEVTSFIFISLLLVLFLNFYRKSFKTE